MPKLLIRIGRLIEKDPKARSVRELRRELRSPIRDARLIALVRIRTQIENYTLRRSYFVLARPLTTDKDPTCRWQATTILGEFIHVDPMRSSITGRRLRRPERKVAIWYVRRSNVRSSQRQS
jgi:hypothetical protein